MYEIYPEETELADGWIDGCIYGQTHAYFLGPVGGGSSTGGAASAPEVIAGTMVAGTSHFYCTACLGAFEETTVWVVDLRSGKRVRAWSVPDQSRLVVSLVLKPDGSVAWVVASDGSRTLRQEWVYAHDPHGLRVLAQISRSGDEFTELALAGNTIYWTEAGRPTSATLE